MLSKIKNLFGPKSTELIYINDLQKAQYKLEQAYKNIEEALDISSKTFSKLRDDNIDLVDRAFFMNESMDYNVRPQSSPS